MNRFDTPPYLAEIKNGRTCRLQARIGQDDYAFVRQLSSKNGAIQVVAATLWQELVRVLKENGITDYTREDDFQQFVSHLRITDGRRTSGGPLSQTNAPDDTRRTESVRGKVTGATKQRAKSQGGNATEAKGNVSVR